MGLSTKDKAKKSKREKVAELRKKHESLLKEYGKGDKAKFLPKLAYIPHGGDERVIALFESEIKGGDDIFTEFVSADYEPNDPERRLWKWPFNKHYEEEYEKTKPHEATGHVRYLIPVDELLDVAALKPEVTPDKSEDTDMDFTELPDSKTDSPIEKMTLRDKCAIDWRKPVSNKPWLNKLIKETFKDD